MEKGVNGSEPQEIELRPVEESDFPTLTAWLAEALVSTSCACSAARLGQGRMWKGFWPKTYGSLCQPGIFCRPLLSEIAFEELVAVSLNSKASLMRLEASL